jgi:prepilin-type N-terminal cleavage/methylation domain-containing protein
MVRLLKSGGKSAEAEMRRNSSAGFTLVETMVAIMVLAVGVLGLAAMLASSVAHMSVSQDEYIAQQKAAEAVESIFTARNTGQKTWNSLCNIGSAICPAGIFTATPTQLCDPGPDGIVGTADDNCALLDSIVTPGPDGKLGTGDDVLIGLSNFTRTITITAIPGTTEVPQITVTINYRRGGTASFACVASDSARNVVPMTLLPPRTPMFRDINTLGFTQLILQKEGVD